VHARECEILPTIKRSILKKVSMVDEFKVSRKVKSRKQLTYFDTMNSMKYSE